MSASDFIRKGAIINVSACRGPSKLSWFLVSSSFTSWMPDLKVIETS